MRYENTLDDLVAFNRYHCAHSRAVKKTKLTNMFLVPLLIIIVTLFLLPTEAVLHPIMIVTLIVVCGLSPVGFLYLYSAQIDRLARRIYSEGTNNSFLCQHELEIDEHGLVERTELSETRHSWQGIEQISETDDHAFIYVSSTAAHVIPKHSVTAGDFDEFMARAKDFWLTATSDTELGNPA